MKLTELEQKVYDFLSHKPNDDIPIASIYETVYGPQGPTFMLLTSNRSMQQQLGPLLARINRKLKEQKIVPGNIKQTYRLISLQQA